MTDITDAYPSTSDLLPIAGAQDDVLAILTTARKRYKRGASKENYIAAGQVCAVGAVAAAAGLTPKKYREVEDQGVFFSGWTNKTGQEMGQVLSAAKIEADTIKAAKTAIRLLNASAKRLFPDFAANGSNEPWSGPLEAVNQESLDFKPAVLACYGDAIKRRTAKVANV